MCKLNQVWDLIPRVYMIRDRYCAENITMLGFYPRIVIWG